MKKIRMNWERQLLEIEQTFGQHTYQDWTWVFSLVNPLLKVYPYDVDLRIRYLYILHNILDEEGCTEDTYKEFVEEFQKVFRESCIKFGNDPKYLFFIGKIMYIGPWYFGLNDNDVLAMQFQRKASKLAPKNKLYRWGVRLSEGYQSASCLAMEILNDEFYKTSLQNMGYAGEYVMSHLKQSSAECDMTS